MEEQYTFFISLFDLGFLFASQWIITQINWGLGVNWGLNYTSICCSEGSFPNEHLLLSGGFFAELWIQQFTYLDNTHT
jgi:hypothetical protein